MPTDIAVEDAMIKRVVTIFSSAPVDEAARTMKKEDIGSLIVTESKKPVGIITREDIVIKVVAAGKKPAEVKVKDIMSSPIVSVSPEDDLVDAAKKMTKHGYERLPVVYLGKLVGIISNREIVKVAPAAIEILRERLLMKDSEGEEEFNAGECEFCTNYSDQLHRVNDKWVCDTCKEEAAEV